MKKVFAVAALSVFALASCKGDYTCDCTVDSSTFSAEYKDVKKKDAEEACNSYETTLSATGSSASCTLK